MRFNPDFSTTITADIQQSAQTLQTALQQVSTNKRVNLPSDDPTASAAEVQNRSANAHVDQYTANANSALAQTQLADSVLSNVVSLLNTAITLGANGATSTNSSANRQQIAAHVQSVLDSMVSQANTTLGGVAIFGGTSGAAVAFKADPSSPGSYTYQGNSGVNYVAVGDTLQVQTNVPGSTVFLTPVDPSNPAGSSAIGSMEELVTALKSGTSASISSATADVTNALGFVSQQHAIYGNSVNQLNSQESYLSQDTITLASQENSLVGIDLATASENLAQVEVQNSAVLAAAAKVLPTSLLTYLK